MATSVQTQDPTMPAQITEAFGKVVSIASEVQQELPSAGFRTGACLVGGCLKQNGTFRYGMNITKLGDHGIVAGAYGNDYEIEISVTDASGKSVVTAREEDGVEFTIKKAGAYFVTAKNKGAQTFVAIAIMQGEGGPKHPISSINRAVADIAAGLKDSFEDGYSAPFNDIMVLGALVDPKASHIRNTSFNSRRWMVIGGSDAGVGSFELSVTDAKTKEVIQGAEDKKYSYVDSEEVIPNAVIAMKNTGTKRILAMQGMVR